MAKKSYERSAGGGEDAFDNYSDTPEVGVGFSDTILLTVSVIGFAIMAFLVYSIIISRVKTSDEVEKGAALGPDGEPLDYEEELLRCDVSTLNRAQRRARAKALMKRQRRAATTTDENAADHDDNDGDGDHEDDNDNDYGSHEQQLSRKERQKAAKAAEKKERHLMEEERREEQRQAMLAAQEEKRKRLLLEAERVREEKLRKEQECEMQRQEELEKWKTFLVSPDGNTSLTVEEWVQELQECQQRTNPSASLTILAERFDVSLQSIKERISGLVQAGRVTGILDEEQDLFIFLSHDQLLSLASFIKNKGEVSLRDLSSETVKLIDQSKDK